MITLYIYKKSSGRLLAIDSGEVDDVLRDLQEDCDFTLEKPPSSDAQWLWNGVRWVRDASKESRQLLQEKVWGAIKAKRLEVITSGVYVASVDKVFHTDDISVIQYSNIGNMIAIGNYEPIEWKVMDNTWVTLTESLFKELQIAMVSKTNKAYQVAEQHKASMLDMDNPEDYDYTTGWEG